MASNQASHDRLASPLALKSRRDSIASVSTKEPIDKEVLAQALDHVHSTASQSEQLTSFDEFAPPPPPESVTPSSGKGLTLQLTHSSLGNIYSRLRASVGSGKESPVSPSKPDGTAGGGKPPSNLVTSPAPSLDKGRHPLPQTQPDPGPKSPVLSLSQREELVASQLGHSPAASDSALVSQRQKEYDAASLDAISFDAATTSAVTSAAPNVEIGRAPVQFDLNSGRRDVKAEATTSSRQSYGGVESLKRSPEISIQQQPRRKLDSIVSTEPVRGRLHGLDKPSDTAKKLGRAADSVSPDFSSNPSKPQLLSVYSQLPGLDESRTTSSDDLRSQSSSVPPLQNHESSRQGPQATSKSPEPRISSKDMMISRMRSKVLSRDFWMKDENAKVCFSCGEHFTTFRRKHHCRLCGQIFCASCTNLISGKPFGQTSKLRACKPCEHVLNGDDSSDAASLSDDEYGASPHVRHLRFSEPSELTLHRTIPLEHSVSIESSKSGLPLSRTTSLARPSSSRSLRSLGARPPSSSYRQRRSRHQHMRSLGLSTDTIAPLRPDIQGQRTPDHDLPAFHTDSIIDPDLAPFLSDEGSSDDEPASIAGTMYGEGHSPAGPGGLAALRKLRSRPLSRGVLDSPKISRDPDSISIASSRITHTRRINPTRTLSMSSLGRHGTASRVIRSENLFNQYQLPDYYGDFDTQALGEASIQPYDPSKSVIGSRDPREIVQRAAELNSASMKHVKKLLSQFFLDSNIYQQQQKWEKVLLPIVLQCAEDVNPNIQRGDDIDIRHYVKLKRAAGGSPSDTRYVSGVIFTKNVALKEMPRSIDHPRILLVAFPLVYARQQPHFMSLDPVIAQEREYLRNLVNRIIALRPQLLLVQRQASGLALQFLQDAGIAVVCNVKDSVMHAVSRCTQTKIISSVEKLTSDPESLGKCEKFEVKMYVHKGLRKSFIFISGCQPDLGCTIFLRGADYTTLAKVKWIVEFICYAVYNLKLETSLLRDQFASLTSTQGSSSAQTKADSLVTGADRQASDARDSNEPTVVSDLQLLNMASERKEPARGRKEIARAEYTATSSPNLAKAEEVAPTTYSRLYRDLEQRALSVSPLVKLADPYLLLRGAELEGQMQQLLQLVNRDKMLDDEEKPEDEIQSFKLVESDMVYESNKSDSPQIRDALRAIHSAEYEKVSHRYTMLKRRWESYISGVVNPFSPLTHQRIVVLFSLVSSASNDSCEGPDLLGMDFYREHDIDNSMEPDVPLGEYVERLIHQAKAPCLAKRCDKDMMNHHRQYVHGKGQIRVFIEARPSRVRGMQSTILMWSVCRICDHETQVVPMSSNSWKYSFAKFLELSFWSDPIVPRAGLCEHDVHRDHFRYFGLNDLAVKIQYDSINIVEVMVPRLRVTWKVEKDLTLKNEQYLKIEERIDKFISSVKHRLKTIKISSIMPGKEEACKVETERLLKLADSDRIFLVDKLKEKYMTSKYFEVIPFNRAVRAMQEKVAEWDKIFTEFEQNYFPSEKDLGKLAAAQLSKAYFGGEDGQETFVPEQQNSEKRVDLHLISPGIDEKSGLIRAGENLSPLPSPNIVTSTPQTPTPELSTLSRSQDVVDNLDLAIQSTQALAPPENPDGKNQDEESLASQAEVEQDTQSPTKSRKPLESGSDRPQNSKPESGNGDTTAAKATNRQTNDTGIPKSTRPKQPRMVSPPLLRSRTQPTVQLRSSGTIDTNTPAEPPEAKVSQTQDSKSPVASKVNNDKKLSERLGLGTARSKGGTQSMIPRSTMQNRFHSKVSSLAKHFEQLSREFEKEKIKERRQRAAKNKHSTLYPVASSKPVVEVFKSAYEAVQEQDSHGGEAQTQESPQNANDKPAVEASLIRHSVAETTSKVEASSPSPGSAEQPGNISKDKDYPESLAETVQSDDLAWDTNLTVETGLTSPAETELDFVSELPKHEKSSLMKMLTSFWSERSTSEWAALDYPLVAGDHIFADSDILVREDEPSSLVAFSIASQDYLDKIQGFRERIRSAQHSNRSAPGQETSASEDLDVEQTMLGKTATHMKYQFQAGSARMLCKIFYTESFDAIRRKCGVDERFVESLSRCYKWDSKGGKTKSLFLKTLDERFILKSLSTVETQSFLKFAPDYFDYTSKCLFHNLPTALAKLMGFYQVVIKNPATGVECNEFLLVMENVFYEGPSNRMFDLKGSMRNRKVQSTGQQDEVLLDENLLDYISQDPLYVQNHSNSTLASSISNDTLFCSKQNVMDYSLIVGLYEDRKELLVGIIDYIRTYTWDKRLESWIKDRGKNKPTVRSPKDYRNRFRASIPRYFPLAPSCWQAFGQQRYDQPGLTWEIPRPAPEELEEVSDDDLVVHIKPKA